MQTRHRERQLEQRKRYRQLELIPSALYQRQTQPQRRFGGWRAIARWIADWLTPTTDPRIYRKVNPSGTLYWHVVDPVTGTTANLDRIDEVYVWLEERYRCRSAGHHPPSHPAWSLGHKPLPF